MLQSVFGIVNSLRLTYPITLFGKLIYRVKLNDTSPHDTILSAELLLKNNLIGLYSNDSL